MSTLNRPEQAKDIFMTLTANTISKITNKHPKAIQDLLDAGDNLAQLSVNAPDPAGFLDPKTVVDTVHDLAKHTLTTGDALNQAKRTAEATIEKALNTELNNNLDYYFKKLEERFDKAAKDYAKAAPLLPDYFTADDVSGWDEQTFTAYRTAKAANGVFGECKAALFDIGRILPAQHLKPIYSNDFLILDADTIEKFVAIQTGGAYDVDKTLRAVNPVVLRAVQDGVDLRLALPAEAQEQISHWEGVRAGMSGQADRELRARVASY